MIAPYFSRALHLCFAKPLAACLLLSLIAGSLHAEDRFELDNRERDKLKRETKAAIQTLQAYHYSQTPFATLDARELIDTYLEALDYGKFYLLASDRQGILERFGDNLKPTYLFVGDLYPAYEIFNLYHRRSVERLEWVHERLNEPFDVTSDAAFLVDREVAEWPEDAAAAEALWERKLTHEYILELLEDQTPEQALDKLRARYERLQRFLDEVELHNVQETFLTALAQLYDPHSNFFSWESFQEFDIAMTNSLVGIGAQLRNVDGACVIERLIPGGPAETSGQLHPGDKIVAVAQGRKGEVIDVVGMKLRKIVQQIRGEPGTTVKLMIEPADSEERKAVLLTRERIELTANLASAAIYEWPVQDGLVVPIGVIELPSFYGEGSFGEGSMSASGDIEELIGKLKDRGVQALVLDLRNNGGGRLEEAIALTGLFIPDGPVVLQRQFNGQVITESDEDPGMAYDGPLVVLVSKHSASASEIVAGALQAHNRAVVVGDASTHGKGTVQMPIELRQVMRRLPFGGPDDVGTVKITIRKFYLPDGASTQNKGVLADIELPSANEFLVEGEADLDHALAWDVLEGIAWEGPLHLSAYQGVQGPLLDELRARSLERRETIAEFDYLDRQISFFRSHFERDVFALNLEQRRTEKAARKAQREAFEEERERLREAYPMWREEVSLTLSEEKDRQHQIKLRETTLPDGSPRANRFYQKVFYYQEHPEADIEELWVEYFDYESMLDEAEALAEVLNTAAGLDIDVEAEAMQAILRQFKNRDRGTDFSALEPFVDVLGEDLDTAALEGALPDFFAKMVELDPDLLKDRAPFDIPLRESLRVLVDWLEISGEFSGSQPQIAQLTPKPVEAEALAP